MNELKVLEIARWIGDEVERLIEAANPPLLNAAQLSDAAGSIASNIREAFGRRKGPERNQFLRYSRGSAEETDEWLQRNVRRKRLAESDFWPVHNRIAVCIKMLNALGADD